MFHFDPNLRLINDFWRIKTQYSDQYAESEVFFYRRPIYIPSVAITLSPHELQIKWFSS